MKKEPHHFSREDFLRAFFGSFIVVITFLFKGSLVGYAIMMRTTNLWLVFITTIIMVSFEIYLLSYRYVNDKKQRPFLEFWAKRFFSITICSMLTAYLLCYVYGINLIVNNQYELFKVCVAIFLPASTAGAAMEMLKKKD